MGAKKWVVRLSASEKEQLREMTRKGRHDSRVLNRARVLLMAHEGKRDSDIAGAVGVTTVTVANVRRRYVEGGPGASPFMASPTGVGLGSWTAPGRLTWWPWPVAPRPRERSGGP